MEPGTAAERAPNATRGESLIEQYKILHGSKDNYGKSSESLIGDIIAHAYEFFGGYGRVKTVLDFGCGRSSTVDHVAAHFKAAGYRYDPAIPEFSTLPVNKADLVINTDVLEHIPEEDVDAFLKTIRSVSQYAFFQIATEAAGTILANGENAHCTVKPETWWLEKIGTVFPNVRAVQSNWPNRLTCVTWRRREIIQDEQAIFDLAKFAGLRGKDCVVFGSAPGPLLGELNPSRPIICCNGSSRTLQATFGRSPALSFIHGHVFARPNPADADVRNALSDVKNIGRAVILDEARYAYDTEIIKDRAKGELRFPWDLRFSMIERLLDANLPFLDISTGAFAVLAALTCGARSAHLVGFSFISKGHSYNANGLHRNHIRSDAALYTLLSQRGYQLSSSDTSISAVLNPILS